MSLLGFFFKKSACTEGYLFIFSPSGCFRACFMAIRSPWNVAVKWIFKFWISHRHNLISHCALIIDPSYRSRDMVLHIHITGHGKTLMIYTRHWLQVCQHYDHGLLQLGSSISETMTAGAIFQTSSPPADKAGRFMVDLKEIRATNRPSAGCYKAGNALTWRMMESKRKKCGYSGQASYFDCCKQ